MTTDRKLVAAASALLDSGGESAVTLRAVASATGLSHNAPYKHFSGRDALLAAVATDDFRLLRGIFTSARQAPQDDPADRLRRAFDEVIGFAQEHPGRYRLLLSNPVVAAQEGELAVAAREAFEAFVGLVADSQAAGVLPEAPADALAGLVFATLLGLLDAEASGRLTPTKGLTTVSTSMNLLLTLLAPPA